MSVTSVTRDVSTPSQLLNVLSVLLALAFFAQCATHHAPCANAAPCTVHSGLPPNTLPDWCRNSSFPQSAGLTASRVRKLSPTSHQLHNAFITAIAAQSTLPCLDTRVNKQRCPAGPGTALDIHICFCHVIYCTGTWRCETYS